MPSPVKWRYGKHAKFYRRKDGAWVRIRGEFVKVGAKRYPHLVHYSMRNIKSDRKRRARKGTKKQLRRYPHEYD